MQTRPTSRLAKNLARTLKTASVRETARIHNILLSDGRPDPSAGVRLVHGYEPKSDPARARMGLPPLKYCPVCKHRRSAHRNHIQKPVQDEPTRRVLWGAWRLPDGTWGSIEDLFKATA